MRDVILQYQCVNSDGASSVTQQEHEESSWASDTSVSLSLYSARVDREYWLCVLVCLSMCEV